MTAGKRPAGKYAPALLQPHYRGGEPEKVDSGVPAAVLRYRANSYQSIVDGDSSSHHYLGLDASLRAFGWRLHHQSSYRAQEGIRTGIALPPG